MIPEDFVTHWLRKEGYHLGCGDNEHGGCTGTNTKPAIFFVQTNSCERHCCERMLCQLTVDIINGHLDGTSRMYLHTRCAVPWGYSCYIAQLVSLFNHSRIRFQDIKT